MEPKSCNFAIRADLFIPLETSFLNNKWRLISIDYLARCSWCSFSINIFSQKKLYCLGEECVCSLGNWAIWFLARQAENVVLLFLTSVFAAFICSLIFIYISFYWIYFIKAVGAASHFTVIEKLHQLQGARELIENIYY